MKYNVFACLALAFQGVVVARHTVSRRNVVEETLTRIRIINDEYSFANENHNGFIKVHDFVPEPILDYFHENNINIYTTDSSPYFVAKFCDTCPLVAAMMEWLTYPVATPDGVLVMQLPDPSLARWWNAPRRHSQDKQWIGDVVWLEPHCLNCAPTGSEAYFPGVSATHQANSTAFANPTTTVYTTQTTTFTTTLPSNMTRGYKATGNYTLPYRAATSSGTVARNATAVVPTTTVNDTETTAFINSTRSIKPQAHSIKTNHTLPYPVFTVTKTVTRKAKAAVPTTTVNDTETTAFINTTRSIKPQGHSVKANHTLPYPVFTVTKTVTQKAKAAVPTTNPFRNTTQSFSNTNTTTSTKAKRTPTWEGDPWFPTSLRVSTPSVPTVTPVVFSAVLGCPTCVGGLRPTAFTKYITLSPDSTVPASTVTATRTVVVTVSESVLLLGRRDTIAVGRATSGAPTRGTPSPVSVDRNVRRQQGGAAEVAPGSKVAMLSFVLAAVALL